MRDINRIFEKLLFSTEEEVRFIANHSHDRLERALAKILLLMADHLTMDYAGQKREKNGQFGKGKKPKSASNTHQKASSQKNQEENRGKTQKAENHEKEQNRAKPVSPKAKVNSGGNISEAQLRRALMSSPKENISGIQRHVRNEAWVKQRDEALRNGILPKSCLTVGEQRIRSLVKSRLKAGDFTTFSATRGDSRVLMRFKEPIGNVYVKRNGTIQMVSTRLLCVVYSHKHGYHFFPMEED